MNSALRSRRLVTPLLSIALIGASMLAATTCAAPAQGATRSAAPSVPAVYATAYAQTAAELDAYARAIHSMPSYSKKPAAAKVGFVELLDANGNRMTALLRPQVMTAVNQSLDAFKRLGVGGVVLGIKLPLLLPQFTAQSSQYTQFFAKVATAARARHFLVDVELGALFCGTVYAQCSYKYPTTVAGFAQITAQQARTVIDKVRPDYLDLISEPNTEATLTGVAALQTVSGFSSYVKTAVAAIGKHGSTKLIAGAASWFPATFDNAIVQAGIDGFAMHIYPATAGTAANLIAVSRLAHTAGKPLIADEVWLYKGKAGAGTIQTANEQGMLNCFSFWQPLDVQFIQATREWAAKTGSPLVSGFWSWQAFAYSTWTPALAAETGAEIQTQTTTAAITALHAHTFTKAGLALVDRT